MIVWGGEGVTEYLNSGGMYNPSTDIWTATSLTGRAIYLTGSVHSLKAVWRAYHVNTGEDGITVLLIDRTGVERVAFGVEQITPEGLSHDIRLLKTG